ncbi:MAG: uridine kinase [Bowdeniella nasicola]|nr:uridine kinase [Bowdeniella nasicola]
MHQPLVVGVAGGSGSGKSTLTRALQRHFPQQCQVVYHDRYYRDHADLSFEQRCQVNYDEPEAFDNALFVTHLQQLIAGQAVDCPHYDFPTHRRTAQVTRLQCAPVIVVEGILILAIREIRELLDIKIFVDTDADVRLLRRIRRDYVERGRDFESVATQYLSTVKPMHALHVAPSKAMADIIIPEGGHNLVALEMLVHRINSALGYPKGEFRA